MVRKVGLESTTPPFQTEYSSQLNYFLMMAVEVGLEPTAATLTALCSTIELLYNMEPRVGLEPTTFALQKRCSTIELSRLAPRTIR